MKHTLYINTRQHSGRNDFKLTCTSDIVIELDSKANTFNIIKNRYGKQQASTLHRTALQSWLCNPAEDPFILKSIYDGRKDCNELWEKFTEARAELHKVVADTNEEIKQLNQENRDLEQSIALQKNQIEHLESLLNKKEDTVKFADSCGWKDGDTVQCKIENGMLVVPKAETIEIDLDILNEAQLRQLILTAHENNWTINQTITHVLEKAVEHLQK